MSQSHLLYYSLLTCLFTGIMKKVTFIPDPSILFANTLFKGLRTLDSHWYSGPFTRRIRDWSCLHLYYCKTPTPRNPTRRKKPDPSLSKRSSWLSTFLTTSWQSTRSSLRFNEHVWSSSKCQHTRRSLHQWSSNRKSRQG